MTIGNQENNPEISLNPQKEEISEIKQPLLTQDNSEVKSNKTVEEDENFKAFREGRKKDRAEKEAAEKRAAEKEAEIAALKAAMEAAFTKPSHIPSPSYYSNDGYPQEESEDERIEKKVQAAIAAREAASEKERLRREQEEYPTKLKQSYPDFHAVITQENLDYLDFHYPQVSRPLNRLNDGYEKWSDIYEAVKKFVPNSKTVNREAMRADINHNKPKSMSGVGLSQPQTLPPSSVLSEDRKLANWERMRRTINGVG